MRNKWNNTYDAKTKLYKIISDFTRDQGQPFRADTRSFYCWANVTLRNRSCMRVSHDLYSLFTNIREFMQINYSINIAAHHHWTATRPTLPVSQWPWAVGRRLVLVFECLWCRSGVVRYFVVRMSFFGVVLAILLTTGFVDSCVPTSVVRRASFCEIGARYWCFCGYESWQYVISDNWSRPSCSNCFVLCCFIIFVASP